MKTFKICSLFLLFTFGVHLSHAQKVKSGNRVNQIVSLYIGIKNALVNNDGTTVNFKANQLYRILSADPLKGLDRDQKLFLADHMADLMDNCEGMCYTIDKSEQRPCFAKFSITLYNVLKGLKINTATIYLQYSPINNAYWISETQGIKNPYYTYKDWVTTGKTTEILAANK
jgi:hypothetical protein